MSSTPLLQVNLRQNHQRLTRPRQIVLEVVKNASRHLTPAEIYDRAKVKYPRLGLATVYRTLDLLVQLGYIQRIHLEQGCHSYAPIERPHGHHLVCSSCGRAVEFANCELEPLMKTLATKTGYVIDVHVLELMGQCPSCQSKKHVKNLQVERRKMGKSKKTSAS
jgi:Fur family ferric uptake transcriptional regulator